jgi:hypothetical protein
MKGRIKLAVGVAALAAMAVAGTVAMAGGGQSIREELTGFEEDPLVLSTTGNGSFRARIHESQQELSYRLRYEDLEGDILQAHIHLPNPPAPTPACPPAPGSVSGTLGPADVVGPADQGIAAGEFAELVDAIRAGVTYANVHTSKYTGGEIRAQLEGDDDNDGDD